MSTVAANPLGSDRLSVRPTAALIARRLTRPGSVFPYTRYLCIDGLAHSFCNHEKDLVCVSPSGYAYEVEIKISIADLKRDARKYRWRNGAGYCALPIRAMSFAMPPEVWAHPDAAAAVPEQCGVFVVDLCEPRFAWQIQIVREAKKVTCAKVSERDRLRLYHLAHDRYWSRGQA